MHNPPHPGLLVKRALITESGLTITDAAEMLGVSRLSLSNLINCHSGISPEMAVRLSIALNTSSEMWLNMQKLYALSEAEAKRTILLKRVKTIKKFKSIKKHWKCI